MTRPSPSVQPATPATRANPPGLTRQAGLRLAWLSWLLLLGIPVVFLVGAIEATLQPGRGSVRPDLAQNWFWLNTLFLLLVVPASFFWRDHLFRSYRHGGVERPGRYLLGMWSIWLPLAIGGLLASSACIASRTLIPNIIPAGVALGFYLFTWPNGHAMTRPVGSVDDPESYEEAR